MQYVPWWMRAVQRVHWSRLRYPDGHTSSAKDDREEGTSCPLLHILSSAAYSMLLSEHAPSPNASPTLQLLSSPADHQCLTGQVRQPRTSKHEEVQTVFIEPSSGDEILLARIQEMEAKIQAS
jgi:hypothetical protein